MSGRFGTIGLSQAKRGLSQPARSCAQERRRNAAYVRISHPYGLSSHSTCTRYAGLETDRAAVQAAEALCDCKPWNTEYHGTFYICSYVHLSLIHI